MKHTSGWAGFERIYRESETYLLGKDLIAHGLETGVFGHAENGAVIFNLEQIGMEGEKAVLRADGTSVYITQDIGTAMFVGTKNTHSTA